MSRRVGSPRVDGRIETAARWRLAVPLLVLLCLTLVMAFAIPALARTDGGSSGASGDSNQAEMAGVATYDVVGGQVIVVFKPGATETRMQQVAASHSASLQKTLAVASRVSGQKIAVIHSRAFSADELVARLSDDSAVAMVSPNYRESIFGDEQASDNEIFSYVYPTDPGDPLFNQLWALNNWGQTGGAVDADIDAVEAWEISTGSPAVVIADLDTGVDYTHVDLAANMWHNTAEVPDNGVDDDGNGWVDDYYGIDTCYYDGDPWDDNGHGTHTSGTIAASGDNSMGVTGVSWSTKIMALKFLNSDGNGSDSDAIEAIYYAIDQKVNHGVNLVAINASWGGGGYNAVLENAIAEAGDAGIIFVAAAGNSGIDVDASPNYPSGYDLPTIVSVGATDHNDQPASFSNYGAESVDLFAPGVNILSTMPGPRYWAQLGDYFYDGMEAGASHWSVDGNVPWEITTELPLRGSWSWSDSPGGQYSLNTDGSIVTEPIDLTAGPANPAFWFYIKHDLEEGWDYLYIDLSGDGGATWTTATSRTGTMSGWGGYGFDIWDHLETEQFRVRFRLVTDEVGTADGVYVDEFGIDTGAGASSNYGTMSGTSMATPHVTGAIAVLAAQHPGDNPLTRINRIRSGVDILPWLYGKANTVGRLNLANSLDPGLVLAPWVTGLSPTRAVVPGIPLTVTGHFFGATAGRIILSDGETEVDASITSWSDSSVQATMPSTMNSTVILERADGYRVVAGSLSMWTSKEPSIFERDGNAAVYLDGRIYSFGGYTTGGGTPTDTGEYYDIASDSWFSSSKLRLPEARVYHAAVALDGLAYVLGGYNSSLSVPVLDSVRAYNPAAGMWQDVAPLPAPLFWHEAVVLDGKIWVFGGMAEVDGIRSPNPDMFVYDPAVDRWSVSPGPATPRWEAAGLALGDKIYLFGGTNNWPYPLASVEVYDPATDSWSASPSMPIPLVRMGATEYNGAGYLIGGTSTASSQAWWYGGQRTVLAFDPASGQWADLTSTLAALPEGYHSCPAVGVEGRGIYSMNGMNGDGSSNRLELLPDPSFGTRTIYGCVRDYNGEPVVGATVDVRLAGIMIGTAQTDANGEYVIDANALDLEDVIDVGAYKAGCFGVTQRGVYDEQEEEVSFFDFRDVGNDQGDRRLPLDDGTQPPVLVLDELMPEPITVTAIAGPNGSVEPATQEVRYEQDATLEVTPSAGYHIEQITVDGIAVPVGDPFVLADVRVDHAIHVTFSNTTNDPSVGGGWNLIAGDAGSDTGGVLVFSYAGAYYSMSAALMQTGAGYWARFASPTTVHLTCSGMPIPVHLKVGWNLVGNSGHYPASLPVGIQAFVYTGGSYQSRTVIQPGQGAWIKSTAVQDVVLTPVP